MMSSCESGGCGGGPEPMIPPPPTFGEVRVNGVEIPPEAIAEEIQHHPAPDAETAWVEAARALAVRELLLQGSHASEDDLKAIDKDIKDIVNDSAEFAKESPEPALEELWTDIYAEDLPQGSAEEVA